MKFLPLIIILLWAGLMASCGGDRRVDTVLTSVDSLVFTAPDSAVRLLDSLTLDCASSAQLDRHALLTAKAREKAGIIVRDDTPDSMLSRSIDALGVAADHFRGRGDSLEVQTLFYRGVLLGYRGDYSEALVSLMEAADRAAETDDNFYRAMSYSRQADTYNRLYSVAKRAEMAKLSAKYFLLAGRPLYALREKMMLAQSLIRINDLSKGFDILNEIKTDTLLTGRHFVALYHRIISEAYFRSGDYRKSLLHSDSINIFAGRLSSIECSSASQAASTLRQFDMAEDYLKKARLSAKTKNDTANYLYSLAQLYSAEGKYDEFHDVFMKYYAGEIDLNNHLLSHPYTTLLTDYYHNSNAENLLKRKSAEENVLTLIFIILIIVILFIVSILIYRKNLRQKDLETHIIMADFQNLARKNAEQLEMQRNSPEADPDVYSLPGKLMNDFCEARYGMLSVGDSHSRFEKRAAEFIDSIDTSEVMSALEHFVDITNDNLMRRFREEFPDLPANYYKVALLSFAGFSVTSISCIIKLKEGSFRNIRSKIRTRINSSDCPDRDRFLSYFQNIRG